MFLDPTAHRHLAILHAFLQDLLDVCRLYRHITLHVERELVSANELFEQFQKREILPLAFLDELLQFLQVAFKEGHNGFIIDLIKFKLVLFFGRFVNSHITNLKKNSVFT